MQRSVFLLCLLGFVAPVPGQAPPGQPVPERAAALDAEMRAALRNRIELGRAALDAGQNEEARDHLVSALGFGPATPELLRALLEVSVAAGDADARLAWAIRCYASQADARGKWRPEKDVLTLLPPGQTRPKDLAVARAAAVEELARFVARRPSGRAGLGHGVLVRWASDLAFELMREAPALQHAHGLAYRKALADESPEYRTVFTALRQVLAGVVKPRARGQDGVVPEQDLDDAVLRAARCLTGMGAQARFKDRKGPPPPPVADEVAAAQQARAKIRRKLGKRVGAPLTLEQLYAMSEVERERFTAEHSTWANPGVAVSPQGRYLVRTVCGFETLLGATETVEMHHARLAGWFGKDPFTGRQGIIRIVPASEGLESEDAPYWWAGGFQRGDLTTVKFNWGTIHALGKLLTHELTHRFDGTIFPFMPAWLVEGRAVWTGGSYTRAENEKFVERFLRGGPCSSAFVKGYGGQRNLRKLVEGTVDDYRDNYTAGYALFVFLSTWRKDGAELYAGRLQRFMSKARAGRKKPLEWFVNNFADGKDGRPENLAAFASMFRGFLAGCYQAGWGNHPKWWSKYRFRFRGVDQVRKRGRRRGGPVMDEPTWVWNRDRAEPWFGQRHAADAGLLLADLGQTRAAAAALLWSLSTDGWQPRAARRLAGLLDNLRLLGVAWTVRHELRRRGFDVAGPKENGAAPMLAALPRLRALLAARLQAARAFESGGFTVAAREMIKRYNRVATMVGRETVPVPPRPEAAAAMYPEPGSPVHLGVHGWAETGLTGYEERRVEGLWYQVAGGDLHVGRRRPRKDSGLLDRRAHQRHAFVRSVEWFGPGAYVFRTRIHFTTSFVSGAVVLGYGRRDRNVRLQFSAGDFLYSIGRKEDVGKTDTVRLSLRGLWRREGHLEGLRLRRKPYKFDKPTSHFDVEVRVDGPTARIYIEGGYWNTYTTADLSPIVGSIGIAMGQGAVRLQNPTVQRLPGSGPVAPPEVEQMLIGSRLPNVPLHRHGTLVVMLPADLEKEPFEYDRWLTKALRRLRPMLEDRLHYPQKWTLLLPKGMPKARRQRLEKSTAEHGFAVVVHTMGKPFHESIYGFYVDAWGGVRAVSDLLREGVGRPQSLGRWARVTRQRQRR